MPQLHKLHPDPVLAANEVYWAPRAFVLRTLARSGWLSTSQLLERYNGLADEPAAGTAFAKALQRLTRQGKVERIGTRNTGRYRLPPGVTLASALEWRGHMCSICGAPNAYTSRHSSGHEWRRRG